MNAHNSPDTADRCRDAGHGGSDLGSRHTGDAVLAAVTRGSGERDTASAGHRTGVHASGIDQRDEFRDSLGVTGYVSALDGSQDFPSGDDQFVPDRDIRVGLVGGELHDEQHGDDREHDRDRGEPDGVGARGRGDGDHLCDDVCECGGHDDAIQPGRVVRATRVIRPATHEDVPALVVMGQQFAQTEMYRDVLHENPEQMAIVAGNLIDHESGAILVLERDGILVGMIGILCTVHFLSGELCAGEVFWWVTPGHRGDGVRLLKAAESWAMVRGAKTLQMIAPTERVGQFYDRMGFTRIETGYQKALNT
jgi:GNAT superfamily N-acetyltransferase